MIDSYLLFKCLQDITGGIQNAITKILQRVVVFSERLLHDNRSSEATLVSRLALTNVKSSRNASKVPQDMDILRSRMVWSEKSNDLSATIALHNAAAAGYKVVARLLLETKADINVKDKNGYIALHEAAGAGHGEIVRLLLEGKADINAADIMGHTALHKAAFQGRVDVVRILLEAKANIEP
jgi:ankyrin repeat protein